MTLLAGTLYDPATAVTQSAAATLAMTALDTTNLRLSFSAPTSGRVLVRLRGVIHGASTYPQILLGVLESGAVKGRIAPQAPLSGTVAATSMFSVEGLFIVSGLAAGSHTFDAAYGVETAVASSGLKYGGPNDTTANNAFGGFAFEIWAL